MKPFQEIRRPEPIVCVDEIAYLRFEKPDLDESERFLRDFGLHRAHRGGDRLYMRGAGDLPFLYAIEKGERSQYRGAAFLVRSRQELETLSHATGTPIEPAHQPGGGEVVRLRDPAGFQVEVLHGIERVAPLPVRREPLVANTPWKKVRVNATQRPELRPSQVVRLGHVVLMALSFETVSQWYMRHLGLIPTDVQCLDDGTPTLAFLRCDRGAEPADHHTVVVAGGIENAFGHAAFECVDLDDVAMGQQVLKAGGWKHAWGLGRHLLGSQIFDYWRDPWGDEFEHYADGDVFDASHPTDYHPFDPSLIWMWGQDLPRDFGPKLNLPTLTRLAGNLLRGRLSPTHLRAMVRAVSRPARPWLARKRPGAKRRLAHVAE